MKTNCYCDFIYNAGCELMLWADSYKMENGWKSPTLLPLEPVGTRPVATLEILTPERWEHCGRRWWALHPVFHVLERFRLSLTGKYSGERGQALVCLCRAGEAVAGWAGTAHGWMGQAASPVAELLYLHSISAGFKMQQRWVSFSLQQGNGSRCFYIHSNFHCSNLTLTALNVFDHSALWKEGCSLLFSTSNISVLTLHLFPLLAQCSTVVWFSKG